jgi:hypothetical protein
MPKQSKLYVGMPVIVNEFDRPCTRLVAVVSDMDIDNDIVVVKYLCAQTRVKTCCMAINRVTPLEDFGVTLIIEGEEMMRCLPERKSVATYYDGRPRPWQPENPDEYLPARPEIVRLLKL